MLLKYCRCKDCGQLYITGVYCYGSEKSNNQVHFSKVWNAIIRDGKHEFNGLGVYVNQMFNDYGIAYNASTEKIYISDQNKFDQCDNLFKEDDMVVLKGKKDCCPICGSSAVYQTYTPYPLFTNPDKYRHLIVYEGDSPFGVFDSTSTSGSSLKPIPQALKAHSLEDEETVNKEYRRIIDQINYEIVASPQIKLGTDSFDIKQYLKGLLDVKVNIYALEQRLHDLLQRQLVAKQNSINAKGKMRKSSIPKAQARLNEINQSIDRIINSFDIPNDWYIKQKITKPSKPSKPKPFTIAEPIEPVYKKPGFFNKKAIMAENEALKIKYESEYADWKSQKEAWDNKVIEYKKALKEYNDLNSQFEKEKKKYKEMEYKKWIKKQYESNPKLIKLQNEKAECLQMIDDPKKYLDKQMKNSPSVVVRDMTDQDLADCTNVLKKAYEAEKTYLSLDILFPKYATLPAVATIYEYFMTGRCNELGGPNGAYNLFESEIRANRVIEQLDAINEKLDQIKSNQYTLYNAVQSVNSQLSNLNNLAGKMIDSLNEIGSTAKDIKNISAVTAYNTAETAYYSKVNAELTKSLGYLIALK